MDTDSTTSRSLLSPIVVEDIPEYEISNMDTASTPSNSSLGPTVIEEIPKYKIPKRKLTNQESHDEHTEPVPRKRVKFANTCFDSSGEYNVRPLTKALRKLHPRQPKNLKIQVEERLSMGVQTFENQTDDGITLGIHNFGIRETTRTSHVGDQTLYSSRDVQLLSNVQAKHIPLPGHLNKYLDHHRSRTT